MQASKIEVPGFTVYFVDDFLTEQECDEWIRHIETEMVESPVLGGNNGEVEDPYRRSHTAWLTNTVPQEAKQLDEKIANFMGVPPECAEGIQGCKYNPGDYYKVHSDYFEPEADPSTASAGARTWSFMIYLNDCWGGGSTYFHALDIAFRAKRGRAVYWHNLNADGTENKNTNHVAMPVGENSVKYIITKWFREKPYPG